MGWTALHDAALNGDIKQIKRQLRLNLADVNAADGKGKTPLHFACENGNVHCIKELLVKGALPNARDMEGRTPLHNACKGGHLQVVKVLLNLSRIDMNAKTQEGDTPLDEAVFSDHGEIVRFLISRNAKVGVDLQDQWVKDEYAVKKMTTTTATTSKGFGSKLLGKVMTKVASINAPPKDAQQQIQKEPMIQYQQQYNQAPQYQPYIQQQYVQPPQIDQAPVTSSMQYVPIDTSNVVFAQQNSVMMPPRGAQQQFNTQFSPSAPILSTNAQYQPVDMANVNFAPQNYVQAQQQMDPNSGIIFAGQNSVQTQLHSTPPLPQMSVDTEVMFAEQDSVQNSTTQPQVPSIYPSVQMNSRTGPGIISLSDLQVHHQIGAGGFGAVHLARYISTGQQVAVKFLASYSHELLAHFQREWSFLFSLQHENIVAVLDHFHDPWQQKIGYTMELMTESLYDRMKRGKLSTKEALHFAQEIAKGLSYLHDRKVAHNDLKPQNVLLRGDGRTTKEEVKLCDFGASSSRDFVARSCTNNQFTHVYASPERLMGEKYSLSADVYSFGVLLNQMLSGELPFKGVDPVAIVGVVVLKQKRPDLAEGIPQAIRALIEQCWSADPEKRPSIPQVRAQIEEMTKVM